MIRIKNVKIGKILAGINDGWEYFGVCSQPIAANLKIFIQKGELRDVMKWHTKLLIFCITNLTIYLTAQL